MADIAPGRAGPSRMRVFRSIPVVPTRGLYLNSNLADGGPIWPDFDTAGPVRLHRRKPVDRAPRPSAGAHARIDAPCVWGGFAQRHFGHLIADHLTRIVESLAQRPDDLFLFVTYPKGQPSGIPAYFWSILDWYGLPRSQVRMVTQPTIVSELRCAPQAERLIGGGPSADYLALLDQIARRNRLVPVESDILYVTRAGFVPLGKGGHAGEVYLVKLLQAMGVAVLDPAHAPLTDQLARYAGARTLVFAEGSAVHGRQLLGHVRQNIVVLRRRPGKSIAKDLLEPRCADLRYADTAFRFVAPYALDGHEMSGEGISFYDTEALFAAFGSLGLDIESRWSPVDYRSALHADAAAWLARTGRGGRLSDKSIAAIAVAFDDIGLDLIRAAPVLRRLNWHARSLVLRNLGKLKDKRKSWSN